MTDEGTDKLSSKDALESAMLELRLAFDEVGPEHPRVLNILEKYVATFHRAGLVSEAEKFAASAKKLREALGPQEASPVREQAPAALEEVPVRAEGTTTTAAESIPPPVTQEASAGAAQSKAPGPQPVASTPGAEQEVNLFSARGHHIATRCGDHIYTPDGRYVGHWDAELGVFLDKRGKYLGEIVSGNRLSRNLLWEFRHLSFGAKPLAGDRPGWDRQRDIEPVTLPLGFEDAHLA